MAAPTETVAARLEWPDFARGASIVMVVLLHLFLLHYIYFFYGFPGSDVVNAVVDATLPLRMPLFFLVGGVAHAHALASAARVGGTSRGRYAAFARARAGRLLRPTVAFLVVWVVLAVLAHLSGLASGPSGDLVAAVLSLSTQLLWFVGIYLGVAALAPATHAWHRRSPVLAVAVPIPVAPVLAVLPVAARSALLPAIPVLLTALPAVLAAILLVLLLSRFLLGRQFLHRLGQHPRVVFGVLQEVFGRHPVVRELRIARQHLVLLDDLLRRATHLALGTRGVENAVDDIAEGARAVLVGTRAFL